MELDVEARMEKGCIRDGGHRLCAKQASHCKQQQQLQYTLEIAITMAYILSAATIMASVVLTLCTFNRLPSDMQNIVDEIHLHHHCRKSKTLGLSSPKLFERQNIKQTPVRGITRPCAQANQKQIQCPPCTPSF